jgi:hypothetical protein
VRLTTLLFDYDPILYAAGSVGEKRTIKVVHRESGDEYEFDTRTQFWGHWKTKKAGWLAEYNKDRETPRLPEEFDITDIQTPEPLENCLQIVKTMIKSTCEAVGVSTYYGYSGKGKVFREDVSTILRYKGNRVGMMRPIHLEELKEYLVKHHACEVVEGIEADDQVSIDSHTAYKRWSKTKSDKDKLVLAVVDKDYYQCAGHIFNTNTCAPICTYDGFGWLKENEKGEVKGRGRVWLYHQVLSSDDSDNYAANSATDMKWGEKKSYNLLKDCQNDKEAFEALVKGYKTLYPSKKKIIGWRGYEDFKKGILLPNHKDFEIEIDWLYVLNENFNLAKMMRTQDEKLTDVRYVLDKLGVEY